MFHEMTIAGCTRQLPLCPISDTLMIAGFVILGDAELTVACAKELITKAPKHDVIVTAESKGIPLAHEMARQLGQRKHIIARKKAKLYMRDVFTTQVHSITTDGVQTLCLDGADASYMQGKRVLVVDDVISTGESLRAIEELVQQAGGNVVGRMAILAEGEAAQRDDLIYLEKLPLFNSDGQPLD